MLLRDARWCRDAVEIWAVDVLTFTGLALHIDYVSGLQGELIGLLGRVLIHTLNLWTV